MNTLIKFVVVAIMLITTLQVFAQKSEEINNSEIKGFFITASDFKAKKLTAPTDMKHKGDKIKLNNFCLSKNITVVEKGEK